MNKSNHPAYKEMVRDYKGWLKLRKGTVEAIKLNERLANSNHTDRKFFREIATENKARLRKIDRNIKQYRTAMTNFRAY